MHSAAASTSEAQLYERHSGAVYRYCLRALGSHEDAEDAAQTTFFQAVRAMRRGVVPTFEQAWLLAIAKNECRSRHRANGRRRRLELARDPQTLAEVAGAPEGPDGTLIGVQEALTRLPETQRRALLLREWQGRSYDEIADELGTTLPAVEALIFRARRALARHLDTETKSRRRAIDVASLLAALKSAFAGGTAVKVAAGVVAAATIGSVAGDAEQRPVRSVEPGARAEAPRDRAATPVARAPASAEKRVATVTRRTRPRAAELRKRPSAARTRIRRADDGASPVIPATESAPPAATTPDQPGGPAAPAAPEQPKVAPVTAPTAPPAPPPAPPAVPKVPGVELPRVELPQLPQAPQLPELPQVPQLPLPDLPEVPDLPIVGDVPLLP